jgi:transcriptional regulator with PAS, ATPase and Fis domain
LEVAPCDDHVLVAARYMWCWMELLGQSPLFLAAVAILKRFARFDVPVLIEGETGTGKELAARAVHYQSPRRDRPFIPVNCGALPDTLVENEFFGHERGAFTDARDSARGLITLADGGTLFLDEIDALSAKGQVTLLRFLQDQRYRPLGAPSDRRADVRIIAATNRQLESLAAQGQFRLDLLFRIKVMFVELPPLRLRDGDATLLAEHFLDVCARRFREPRKRLARSTIAWIDRYEWPGNVRELENTIMRQCLMTDAEVLVFPSDTGVPEPPESRVSYAHAKARALAEFDRAFLRNSLLRAGGNVTRAANDVQKDRRAFGRLMKKYGISVRDFRR